MDSPGTSSRSQVECTGPDRSRCGYCRTRFSAHNFGTWAYRLDVHDYQGLLDAGWRRSGNYLYRPNLPATCCPPYVIRLDASKFVPSSTQKRVLKRVRRWAARDMEVCSVVLPVSSTHDVRERSDRGDEVRGDTSWMRGMQKVVLDAVMEAVDWSVREGADGTAKVSADAADAVRSSIKVFPPRASMKGKLQDAVGSKGAVHTSASSVGTDSPHWVSNVALLLAAAERKGGSRKEFANLDDTSQSLPSTKLKERGKRTITVEQVRRQVEVARLLADYLQDVPDIFEKVTVTKPGFINFWLRCVKGDEEDANAGKDIGKEAVMRDVSWSEAPTGDACLKIPRLKDRTVPDMRRGRMKGSGAMPAASMPLSRLGSEVSAEHTPEPPDTASLAEDVSREPEHASQPIAQPGPHAHLQQGFGVVGHLSEGECFTMELVPSQFRAEAFELFRKYQMTVHSERTNQCSEETYIRFLVESPLVQECASSDGDVRYGSFHILYRMSGRLFAVGVVDILPQCLSSVYLFYDPDFAKLSPGTLSAIKEIEWVRHAARKVPSLRFYYMGYYIHTCAKMRYKASYHPSEILCEETKNWIAAPEAQAVLDSAQGGYSRLAPPRLPLAPGACGFRLEESEVRGLVDASKMQVDFHSEGPKVVSFQILARLLQTQYPAEMRIIRERLRQFILLVGRDRSQRYLHIV